MNEFMGASGRDRDHIHDAADAIRPLVPGLIDVVLEESSSNDATRRQFVRIQSAHEGDVPKRVHALTPDHPMIAFRKQHPSRHLTALVTRPCDGSMVTCLDLAGKYAHQRPAAPSRRMPPGPRRVDVGFLRSSGP
ncbi:MAG: hypothetical protein GY741_06350 [Phycisphaeraceae bacterium]|nr:hypothetical protein [Phycisphaeraceae bacterium]